MILTGQDKTTGMSLRAIVHKIGRSAASVGRELRRNVDRSGCRYRYDKAHSYAQARLRRCRRGPNFDTAQLEAVHGLLHEQWSPEQISGRMPGKVPLAMRPLATNLRQEFGHWEGDTVMGSDARHCLLTLVERKTCLVCIIKLPARRACEANAALARELGHAGTLIMNSLALDNGTEFHGF